MLSQYKSGGSLICKKDIHIAEKKQGDECCSLAGILEPGLCKLKCVYMQDRDTFKGIFWVQELLVFINRLY